MEQLTTYRAKGKEKGLEMLFKYSLNGNLKVFEIIGELLEKQSNWLFQPNRFPSTEEKIKYWIKLKEFSDKFDVQVSPADLSFEAFWKLYDLKVKKEASEKAYNKLNDSDKIKCFLALKQYNKHLADTKQAKAHLVTWINQKRYNDEY